MHESNVDLEWSKCLPAYLAKKTDRVVTSYNLQSEMKQSGLEIQKSKLIIK